MSDELGVQLDLRVLMRGLVDPGKRSGIAQEGGRSGGRRRRCPCPEVALLSAAFLWMDVPYGTDSA
jgi:hypothetical protein